MLDSGAARLRDLYVSLTDGTTSSFEWAWIVARIAVVFIATIATYLTFGWTAGAVVVALGAIIVLLYSALLARMLLQDHVRAVFALGFLFDNLVIIYAWWTTKREDRFSGGENDLWLILIPVTIIGVARTGPKIGLAYTGFTVAVLAVMTLQFDAPGSYSFSQLPVRMVFLGMAGALSTWLVSELNLERDHARALQFEAETLTEISTLVGLSIDPIEKFDDYAPYLRSLVPYDLLIIGEIDRDQSKLVVRGLDDPNGAGTATDSEFDLQPFQFALNEPPGVIASELDGNACSAIASLKDQDGRALVPEVGSLAYASIVSGDQAVAVLLACSGVEAALAGEHVRVISRTSEMIGASLNSQRVYSQSIQLANEREARLMLDATNRQLQQDSEARDVFLSAVSHELRTPLTSIIAFNDLLLRNRGKNLEERQLTHLNLIRRNSTQLLTLVEDLLDLSYLGSSRVKLVPEIFNPSELIEQIAASIAPLFKVKMQRLSINGGDDGQQVTADRQRLFQVVGNLLSNASKYSPERGEVVLTWSVNEGRFEMTVSDRGSGIPEEEQEHIFQPFYRATQHRVDKIPGTGLGLVISRTLVEAHGGEIMLSSSDGANGEHGTEVIFWIPADGSGIRERLGRDDAA